MIKVLIFDDNSWIYEDDRDEFDLETRDYVEVLIPDFIVDKGDDKVEKWLRVMKRIPEETRND